MNKRQKYALAHPLDTATGGPGRLAPYKVIRAHPSGLLLMTILAVDR